MATYKPRTKDDPPLPKYPKIGMSYCPSHRFISLMLHHGGGTGHRLLGGKCCGFWRDDEAREWILRASDIDNIIKQLKSVRRTAVATERAINADWERRRIPDSPVREAAQHAAAELPLLLDKVTKHDKGTGRAKIKRATKKR